MKFNKYILNGFCALGIASCLGTSVTSCSSDFLDEELTTKFSTEYFETAEGLEALTISLYGHLRWRFGYDHGNAFTLLGTDEWTAGNAVDNEMWNTYDYRLSPAVQTVNGNTCTAGAWWDEMYFGVSSANTIIANADKITDEKVRKRCLAHAYLSRGLDFYTLTAFYGAVVLQTEPVSGVVRSFQRSTPEECWEQVISDFRQAYNLFEGEEFTYGHGMTWTKATAAHWLAKALLFRCSERNASWNSSYKEADLTEAIQACSYAIGARSLEKDYNNLFNNWTDVDCPLEESNEILMAATHNSDSNTKGRYGNQALHMFNSQFSNYSGGYVKRGMVTGGKDFQRCMPTEYTYGVFDHVNDARLWKSFRTVYGNNGKAAGDNGVTLGDPAIIMILNTKDDHTYDSYKFGAVNQSPTFRDDAGRLPEWSKSARQTQTSGSLTSRTGQWVPCSSILYQNGTYVQPTFKTSDNLARCNFFASLCKTVSGAITSDGSQNSFRDVTMARLGETYLVRAECYVRQGEYAKAMADINVLRERAQWKSGENRSYFIDGCCAFENNTNYATKQDLYDNTNLNMNTYYLSNPTVAVTTEASDLKLKSFPNNLPAEDEAVMAKLGVTSDYDRALNFILNERTRELAGEWMRWETLSRTGTLALRYKAFHPEAALGNFQEGKHELRPIPQTFIDGLLNEDGTNLSDEQKAAWQNPGY